MSSKWCTLRTTDDNGNKIHPLLFFPILLVLLFVGPGVLVCCALLSFHYYELGLTVAIMMAVSSVPVIILVWTLRVVNFFSDHKVIEDGAWKFTPWRGLLSVLWLVSAIPALVITVYFGTYAELSSQITGISVADAIQYPNVVVYKFTDGDILPQYRQCGKVWNNLDTYQFVAIAPIVPSANDFLLQQNTTFPAFAITTSVSTSCQLESGLNWNESIREGINTFRDKGDFNMIDVSRMLFAIINTLTIATGIVISIYSNFSGTNMVMAPVLEWKYVDGVINREKESAYSVLTWSVFCAAFLSTIAVGCFIQHHIICYLCRTGSLHREDELLTRENIN